MLIQHPYFEYLFRFQLQTLSIKVLSLFLFQVPAIRCSLHTRSKISNIARQNRGRCNEWSHMDYPEPGRTVLPCTVCQTGKRTSRRSDRQYYD